MKILFLILITLISTQAKDVNYGSVAVEAVTSIYDGDTFRVNIAGYPSIVGDRIPIRINGIDTPEIRGKCTKEKTLARKAKQFTVSKLRGAKVIELRNIQRGKYFRIVADVFTDNKSLADELIKNNLAVRYNGGTKIKNWCK